MGQNACLAFRGIRFQGGDSMPLNINELQRTQSVSRARALRTYAGFVAGNPLAAVVAVKGAPRTGDPRRRGFLDGPDGDALYKTLESMGYPDDPLLAVELSGGIANVLGAAVGASRAGTEVAVGASMGAAGAADADDVGPGGSNAANPGTLSARDLRKIVEIVDPLAVVALDDTARQTVLKAFGDVEVHEESDRTSGAVRARALGRLLVFVDDLEGSLEDMDAKRAAWANLRALFLPLSRGGR